MELVDVIDGDRGKNYPTESDFDINGHTLFLNASNVTTEGFSFDNNQFISEEKSNGMGNGKLNEDDIIITSRGSLGHVAWYNAYIHSVVPYARINSGMLILRKKTYITTSYLYQFLKSEKGQNQISFMSFGSAQPQLTKKGVEGLIVNYPGSLNEQDKLGKYFTNLDNLITLHQRKLFMHFFYAKTWEQRKVLDLLVQPVTDGPHETPELVEEGVPFISVDAIVDNKIDFNRKRGNISEEYDELCCKKYKPQLYDVYLVKSGSTVGKVAIVETTDRFNIWSPLAAMRCGDKTNPYFLYNLLQTKAMQAQVSDKASNGTQPNLSMRALEKFPVIVPINMDEQKKIGEYFSKVDHLITLHRRAYLLPKRRAYK